MKNFRDQRTNDMISSANKARVIIICIGIAFMLALMLFA